ncbi:MAG TPA: D-alanyl-D-alanine carboxypeptidase/D-alanyl-D-alanine-endopeptidase [Chitinophagaceae bacterium]|nr:D-alanyl-D-alanine carboxypeptidase/D-alanyl-D-alanine-endopeptidase [Chitinophagaceae bacterium]
MKKAFLSLLGSVIITGLLAQTVSEKLQKAFRQFEADSQLKHAISSLYVIDANTGEVVFDKNSQIGLAGASTQKIVTAATAFELLGKDYKYETRIGYDGNLDKGVLDGNIIIIGSGDPTFGSWRWENTTEAKIMNECTHALGVRSIKKIGGDIKIFDEGWSSQHTPDGWIMQDVGNYYGAGPSALNWRENQFDVFLKSGDKIGDPVAIVGYEPHLYLSSYYSEVNSASKGSGDNAYIYQNPGVIRGTIPVDENRFKISGSMEQPGGEFILTLKNELTKKGIVIEKSGSEKQRILLEHVKIEYEHYSPPLDSIIYWFLKKSINLYGEALIKTFAHEKQGFGSTDSGTAIIKKFWKEKGLDESELNIYDGSGLSPLNRITTHAQVEVLKFAKTRPWFSSFYYALPEYNAMKMKSGTISDVKGFCGYHKAKDGREYIFSFLVNNYNGRTSPVVNKMYKVLDELK